MGICDAIKTFLPAEHETPKVYRKPLSSDVCISSGILGAVVERNREKQEADNDSFWMNAG